MAGPGWPLLQQLGWSEVPQDGGTIVVRPKDSASGALDIPEVFPSVAEAVEHVRSRCIAIPEDLAHHVINEFTRIAFRALKKSPYNWKHRSKVDTGSRTLELQETFPPAVGGFFLPPDYPNETDPKAVEGVTFFSLRLFVRLLLDLDEGVREFRGLDQQGVFEDGHLLHFTVFSAVWGKCLGAWDVTNFMRDSVSVVAPDVADTDHKLGVNAWESKRAFFRACLEVLDRKYSAVPMSAATGDEPWKALWCKLVSHEGWDWAARLDGMPVYVAPDGQVFDSTDKVVTFVRAAAEERRRQTALLSPPHAPVAYSPIRGSTPQAPSFLRATRSSERNSGHTAGSARPSFRLSVGKKKGDLSRGDKAVSLQDDWSTIKARLQAHGWGIEASPGRPERLYPPGMDARQGEASREDYLEGEQEVRAHLQQHYKLSVRSAASATPAQASIQGLSAGGASSSRRPSSVVIGGGVGGSSGSRVAVRPSPSDTISGKAPMRRASSSDARDRSGSTPCAEQAAGIGGEGAGQVSNKRRHGEEKGAQQHGSPSRSPSYPASSAEAPDIQSRAPGITAEMCEDVTEDMDAATVLKTLQQKYGWLPMLREPHSQVWVWVPPNVDHKNLQVGVNAFQPEDLREHILKLKRNQRHGPSLGPMAAEPELGDSGRGDGGQAWARGNRLRRQSADHCFVKNEVMEVSVGRSAKSTKNKRTKGKKRTSGGPARSSTGSTGKGKRRPKVKQVKEETEADKPAQPIFLPGSEINREQSANWVWRNLVDWYGWKCVDAPRLVSSTGLAYLCPAGPMVRPKTTGGRGREWFEDPAGVKKYIDDLVETDTPIPSTEAARNKAFALFGVPQGDAMLVCDDEQDELTPEKPKAKKARHASSSPQARSSGQHTPEVDVQAEVQHEAEEHDAVMEKVECPDAGQAVEVQTVEKGSEENLSAPAVQYGEDLFYGQDLTKEKELNWVWTYLRTDHGWRCIHTTVKASGCRYAYVPYRVNYTDRSKFNILYFDSLRGAVKYAKELVDKRVPIPSMLNPEPVGRQAEDVSVGPEALAESDLEHAHGTGTIGEDAAVEDGHATLSPPMASEGFEDDPAQIEMMNRHTLPRPSKIKPVSSAIAAEDMQDFSQLMRKLTRFYGWKHKQMNPFDNRELGVKADRVYVPPGGKLIGGVEGTDFYTTQEEVTSYVYAHYLRGDTDRPQGELTILDGEDGEDRGQGYEYMEQDAALSPLDPDHALAATEKEGPDGSEKQGQGDEAGAAVGRAFEDVALAMEVDEQAAGDNVGSYLETKIRVNPELVFDRDYLLELYKDPKLYDFLNTILVTYHGWKIVSSGIYNLIPAPTQSYIWVLPGRREPIQGGKPHQDFLMTWDELKEYILNGYALKPRKNAPHNAVPADAAALFSPVAQARTTRSGQTYGSTERRDIHAARSASSSASSSPACVNTSRLAALDEAASSQDSAHSMRSMQSPSEPEPSVRAKRRLSGQGQEQNQHVKKGSCRVSSSGTRGKRSTPSFLSPLSPHAWRPVSAPSRARANSVVIPDSPAPVANHDFTSSDESASSQDKQDCTEDKGPKLTSEEVDRYTYKVLLRKGFSLTEESQPVEGTEGDATGYVLTRPAADAARSPAAGGADDEQHVVVQRFWTDSEALLYARGEGGLVTEEELEEQALADPWKPTIDALAAVVDRHGPSGFVDLRKNEVASLLQFLRSCVCKPEGGLIYLAGLPGTGKSLTVKQCQRALRRELKAAGFKATPKWVYLNGANARECPLFLLQALATELGLLLTERDDHHRELRRDELVHALEKRLTLKHHASTALSALQSPTSSSKDQGRRVVSDQVVLVVDEVDRFLASSDMVKDLARMALAPNGSLILITISNVVGESVPDGLSPKEQPGFRDLAPPILFKPYDTEDLKAILQDATDGLMEEAAVTLVARRVSAGHGDARMAILQCIQAAHVHMENLRSRSRECVGSAGQQHPDFDKARKVPVRVVQMLQKTNDADAGRQICNLTQHQALLLLVVYSLECSAPGRLHEVDVRFEFTDAAKKTVAIAKTQASATFNQVLDDLLSLNLLTRGPSRGHKNGPVLATRLDPDTVLTYLKPQWKQVFKQYLPKMRSTAAAV